MSRGRGARRLLDPWAGLLVAALVVLAVVVLLAMPGPWQSVGGPEAPVTLGAPPPSDVAVFVLAGSPPGRCTAVVWLHAAYGPPRLTAVLVPPEVCAAVPGGGYAPLRRLVTDLDPGTASEALGDALGVDIDGWVAVDETGFGELLAAGSPSAGERDALPGARETAAFRVAPRGLGGLQRQHRELARGLGAARRADVSANAVVNYLLGSPDVRTDLDLRAVTPLVQAFLADDASGVAVRTAAVIVEVCGPAREWRLDESRLERLRLSFGLGLRAPAAAPRIAVRPRAAEVLVVVPPDADGESYAAALRDALLEQGSRPLTVRAAAGGGEEAGEGLAALLARRRPLAVVLAAWAEAAPTATATPGAPASDEAGEDAAPPVASVAGLEAMAETLRRARQPAVLVAPPAGAPDALREAATTSGLPLVDAAPGSAGEPLTPAQLVAAATARACWPAYLAPDLPATRLEFSYAARRVTLVSLPGDPPGLSVSWLRACGYDVAAEAASGWEPPAGTAIAYRPGARRAALSLAGDLGWSAGAVARDPSAPSVLTVVAPPG